jgi:large subunit ribosomal protein L7/L12
MDEDLRIAVYELQQRVAALEARIGVEAGAGSGGQAAAAPVSPTDDPEIQALLRDGQEIQAIKLLRERTGLGLVEAKHAIDTARRI